MSYLGNTSISSSTVPSHGAQRKTADTDRDRERLGGRSLNDIYELMIDGTQGRWALAVNQLRGRFFQSLLLESEHHGFMKFSNGQTLRELFGKDHPGWMQADNLLRNEQHYIARPMQEYLVCLAENAQLFADIFAEESARIPETLGPLL